MHNSRNQVWVVALIKSTSLQSIGFIPAVAIAFISGVCAALAFQYNAYFWLWLLGHVLLYRLLQISRYRHALMLAGIFGIGYFLCGLYWLFDIASHFEGHGKWTTGALILSIILLQAMYYVLIASIVTRFTFVQRKSAWWWLGILPASACLSEWIRSWLWTGFPWQQAGYLLVDRGFNSLLPLTGILGLSLLLYFGVGLLCLVLTRLRWNTLVMACCGLACLAFIVFSLRQVQWTQPLNVKPLNVQVIQGDFDLGEKDSRADVVRRIKHYAALAGQAPLPDISLWPESTASTDYRQLADAFTDSFSRLAKMGTTVLFGGYLQDGERKYNAIIDASTGEASYRKQHLIPFGEYSPTWFSWVSNAYMSRLVPGTGQTGSVDYQELRLAASICFEVLFGDELRDRLHGSHLHVHTSDVGWFSGGWVASYLLLNARVRAIESQKPALYSSNKGLSAVIAHNGVLINRGPTVGQYSVYGEVKPRFGGTFYTRWGSWPIVMLCASMLLCGVFFSRIDLVADAQ